MSKTKRKTTVITELNPYNPLTDKKSKKELENFRMRIGLIGKDYIERVDTYQTKLIPLFKKSVLNYTKLVRGYNTAASVGTPNRTSFMDLFLMMNCLGFVTHSKASECLAFENREQFQNEAFEAEAIRVLGDHMKGFTPAAILSAMHRDVRKSSGVLKEDLIRRLHGVVPDLEKRIKKSLSTSKVETEVTDIEEKIEEHEEDLRLINLGLESGDLTAAEAKDLEASKKSIERLKVKRQKKLETKKTALAAIKADREAMERTSDFFDSIYHEIVSIKKIDKDSGLKVNAVSSTKDLKANLKEVLACFDRVLKGYSGNFKVLENDFSILDSHNPPSRIIAFDRDQKSLALNYRIGNKEMLPYYAVSFCNQRRVRLKEVNTGDFSKEAGKGINLGLLGQTNEPFSRPLGAGVDYYKNTSTEDILKDLKMDDSERSKVDELKTLYDMVEFEYLFDKDSGSKYRTALGGKLGSFISNFWSRLHDLNFVVESFQPWDLAQEVYAAKYLFKKTYLGLEGFKDSLQYLNENIPALKQPLMRLAGYSDDLPTPDDISIFENISKITSSVASDLKTLAKANKERDEKDRLDMQTPPPWLKTINKIVHIGGGVEDIQDEFKDKVEEFNYLLDQVELQISSLGIDFKKITSAEWVSKISKIEAQRMKGHKDEHKYDYEELGYRRVLSSLVKTIRDQGNVDLSKKLVQTLLDRGIVPGGDSKSLVSLNVFEGKGDYYRSPFSTSRHSALPINLTNLKKFDFVQFIKDCPKWAQFDKDKNMSGRVKLNKKFCLNLKFRVTLLQVALNFLPDNVPTSLILRDPLPLIEGKNCISPILDQKTELEAPRVRKIINLYFSKITSLSAEITQTRAKQLFNLRRVGTAHLGLIFKTDADGLIRWKLPEGFLGGKRALPRLVNMIKQGIFTDLSKDSGVEETTIEDETINTLCLSEDDIKVLVKDKIKIDGTATKNTYLATVRKLMRELPHHLGIDLGLEIESGKLRTAFMFGKTEGTGSNAKKGIKVVESASLAVLTNDPVRLGKLEDALTHLGTNLGDVEIQFDQRFIKELNFLEDCRVKVKSCRIGGPLRYNINVPVMRKITAKEVKGGAFVPKQFVGIDTGEDGIGYTTREIANRDNITSCGFLRLRGTRHLKNMTSKYRNKIQPKQDYEKVGDSKLSKKRKWTVGEMQSNILSIMYKYDALPLFENNISGLTSGNKVLENVYKDIIELFTFSSDNGAANSRREHLFFGSSGFYLDVPVQGKIEKVWMGPGRKVSGMYTSQECSCCGRNIFKEVKDSDREHYEVDAEGNIDLDSRSTYSLRKQGPSNGVLRGEFNIPVKPGKISKENLKKQLKKQARRAPLDKRSTRTSQSTYVCMYTDCPDYNVKKNADAAASTNISGRSLF